MLRFCPSEGIEGIFPGLLFEFVRTRSRGKYFSLRSKDNTRRRTLIRDRHYISKKTVSVCPCRRLSNRQTVLPARSLTGAIRVARRDLSLIDSNTGSVSFLESPPK